MLNDHLWRSNEILGIGCAQRSKVSNLGLFFSVFTKNSCRSMPVESVYSWLESSQKGEHVNDVHCFSLKSYHTTQRTSGQHLVWHFLQFLKLVGTFVFIILVGSERWFFFVKRLGEFNMISILWGEDKHNANGAEQWVNFSQHYTNISMKIKTCVLKS